MSNRNRNHRTSTGSARFATTHWSVVSAAGKPESTKYRQALETLCQTYWFPLYAYLRRQGHNCHQAEDYTQAFFAHLLEKRGLRLADPKQGKFRSFLLASLKNFVANELDRIRSKKRGGGEKILSLDIDSAEHQYGLEAIHELTAEKLFERSWAMTVLNRTMAALQDEFAGKNKQELFENLKVYLTAKKSPISYRDAATQLNISEAAVKVAVHRLRKRYRELLRNEIAQTVTTEEEISEEIRELFAALSN